MGKWVSGAEAARHLNVTESAVRKRAAAGRIDRRATGARGAGTSATAYEYWLEDDQLDATVQVETAMEASGIDVLARVIEETARNQQDALEAIKQAYAGQLAAKDELIAELRERAGAAESSLEAAREELRAAREQERNRVAEVDDQLRAAREAMRERSRRWWRFWA